MKHFEAKGLYQKIKGDATDEMMDVLGITVEKLERAIQQCMDKGLSKKKAIETVYKLWQKAGEDYKKYPSDKEMELMGFSREGDNWKHPSGVEFNDNFRTTNSFGHIESLVLLAKQK
jgi:hypothetical protein